MLDLVTRDGVLVDWSGGSGRIAAVALDEGRVVRFSGAIGVGHVIDNRVAAVADGAAVDGRGGRPALRTRHVERTVNRPAPRLCRHEETRTP
jgi:hypothetical protein